MFDLNQILNIFQIEMLYICHQLRNKNPTSLVNDLPLPTRNLFDVFLIYPLSCRYNLYNSRPYILNYRHDT